MTSKTYRLKIVNGETAFEAEGDKKFVLDMASQFGQARPISPVTTTVTQGKGNAPKGAPSVSKNSLSKGVSIREFVQQLDLKKHTDITLAFGYYLEKQNGLTHFSPADINKCYYDAKMESSNTSEMITRNIKNGRMMEAKGSKNKGGRQYTLTVTGEKYIEQYKKPSQS